MLDLDRVRAEYNLRQAKYHDITREARYIIESAIANNNIKIHNITYRVKEFASLVKKCEEKSIEDPFDVVNDIAGIRVVCLFRSDLIAIESIIQSAFELIEVDNKIDAADGFGYMSIHYTCKMRRDYKGPRYDHIRDFLFEIQTRTLCMDAWAAVSHYLSYKGDWDVPSDLKRAMNALSGLFYVADNEFLHVYNESVKSKLEAESAIENVSKSKIPINFDTILAFMKEKFSDRPIPDEDIVSPLVHQITLAGYKNIMDIDEDFSNAFELFVEYEKEILGNKRIKHQFSALGALRVVLSIANIKIEEMRSRDKLGNNYPGEMKAYRDAYLNKHPDRSLQAM